MTELRNLDEFHAAIRAGNVIVITDGANGNTAHHPDCSHVKDNYFIEKVIDGKGKNGGYFAVSTAEEAARTHGALPCGRFYG